ncbi:MAG: hypothetical protein V3571_01500, partial [Pseudodesulfovibrio sp.]
QNLDAGIGIEVADLHQRGAANELKQIFIHALFLLFRNVSLFQATRRVGQNGPACNWHATCKFPAGDQPRIDTITARTKACTITPS